MPLGAASLGQEHRCSALPDIVQAGDPELSLPGPGPGKGSHGHLCHQPGPRGRSWAHGAWMSREAVEAASSPASPHRTPAAQVQIQPLGISSRHRELSTLSTELCWSNCPGHSHQEQPGSAPSCSTAFAKGAPSACSGCARPLLPSETHPHLTSQEASVSTLGAGGLRAGTRGPLFQPQESWGLSSHWRKRSHWPKGGAQGAGGGCGEGSETARAGGRR